MRAREIIPLTEMRVLGYLNPVFKKRKEAQSAAHTGGRRPHAVRHRQLMIIGLKCSCISNAPACDVKTELHEVRTKTSAACVNREGDVSYNIASRQEGGRVRTKPWRGARMLEWEREQSKAAGREQPLRGYRTSGQL